MYTSEIKNSLEGKKITLRGWAHELRDLAKIKFVLLRDEEGIIQCAIKTGKAFDNFGELSQESVIEITGNVKKAQVKSPEVSVKDFEIEVVELNLLNKAEVLPIQVVEKDIDTGLAKRLDYRSLDIRKPRVSTIFKIQSTIANSFREFFYKKGFIEIRRNILTEMLIWHNHPNCINNCAQLVGVKYFPLLLCGEQKNIIHQGI
ncbi:hypothetical protein J4438_00660 [Candidatus Woesearchaeota archaeon]|nr:hypothetical protein [Candidatus Woesearchaeota archaeon]